MVPLVADQPGEIGFCDFTKIKRVEITLRGEPFPHLLAACGGAPKALRTVRLHHDRLPWLGGLERDHYGLLVHHGHIVGIKGES